MDCCHFSTTQIHFKESRNVPIQPTGRHDPRQQLFGIVPWILAVQEEKAELPATKASLSVTSSVCSEKPIYLSV